MDAKSAAKLLYAELSAIEVKTKGGVTSRDITFVTFSITCGLVSLAILPTVINQIINQTFSDPGFKAFFVFDNLFLFGSLFRLIYKTIPKVRTERKNGFYVRPEITIVQPVDHEEFRLKYYGKNAKILHRHGGLDLPFDHDKLKEFFPSHEEAFNWVEEFIGQWDGDILSELAKIEEQKRQDREKIQQERERRIKQKRIVETKKH